MLDRVVRPRFRVQGLDLGLSYKIFIRRLHFKLRGVWARGPETAGHRRAVGRQLELRGRKPFLDPTAQKPESRGLKHPTQSLQNPLIKEYTLNYNRIPNMI